MCKCGMPNASGKRYCLSCAAAYMREWRKSHPLTVEQRRKDNARSYAGVYKRRGKLTPQPCESCRAGVVQMHHDDYSRPLAVRWMCRACHLGHHRQPQTRTAHSGPS